MRPAPRRFLGAAHRISRNSEILMKSPLPAHRVWSVGLRCLGYVGLNGELSQLKYKLCIEVRLMMKTLATCFLFRYRQRTYFLSFKDIPDVGDPCESRGPPEIDKEKSMEDGVVGNTSGYPGSRVSSQGDETDSAESEPEEWHHAD